MFEASKLKVFSIYRAHMPVRNHPSHCCTLCGSRKRNVVRCPLPGAAEFRKLRQSVKSLMKQQPMKRFKPKLGVKLSNKRGKVKKKAKEMYGTRKIQNRAHSLRKRAVAESLVDKVGTTAESAYNELLSSGFLQKPRLCRFCHEESLSEPLARGGCQETAQGGQEEFRPCGHVTNWNMRCKRNSLLSF